MEFPRKNSVLGQIFLNFSPSPTPIPNANFTNIVVSASLIHTCTHTPPHARTQNTHTWGWSFAQVWRGFFLCFFFFFWLPSSRETACSNRLFVCRFLVHRFLRRFLRAFLLRFSARRFLMCRFLCRFAANMRADFRADFPLMFLVL